MLAIIEVAHNNTLILFDQNSYVSTSWLKTGQGQITPKTWRFANFSFLLKLHIFRCPYLSR